MIGVAIGCVCLLTSCIKGDSGDCPESYPRELRFIYYGNGNTDVFPSHINSVDLYVFDEQGAYINNYTYTQGQLNALQGANLTLPQGNYTIVCWGNVTGLSTITNDNNLLDTYHLYSTPYLNREHVTDFDSLYYGKHTLAVSGGTNARDTVYFQSSHINMEVYVQGLRTAQTRAEGDPNGWFAVRSVFAGYDFDMEVTEDLTDVYPDLVDDTTGEWVMSRFRLFRFRNRNDIVLDFYNGEGELVYVLPLQDFLATHQINVEGVNEITVPIRVSFEGTNVHVSVAEWDEEVVKPVF